MQHWMEARWIFPQPACSCMRLSCTISRERQGQGGRDWHCLQDSLSQAAGWGCPAAKALVPSKARLKATLDGWHGTVLRLLSWSARWITNSWTCNGFSVGVDAVVLHWNAATPSKIYLLNLFISQVIFMSEFIPMSKPWVYFNTSCRCLQLGYFS